MALPGGNLLAGIGGYIQLWNWRFPPTAGSSPPIPTNYQYLDVAYWKLERERVFSPLSYSGCAGSRRRRGVILDWRVTARVWWDYEFAPDVLLQQGDTTALKLVIGAEASWTGNPINRATNFQNNNVPSAAAAINNQIDGLPANGFGILPPDGDLSTFLPCYCAPQAVYTSQMVEDDSQGDDDSIVFQDIVLEADSLLFYIPDTGEMQVYADYLGLLVQQNFIAPN